jgi:transcription antitermination protein NusB
MSARYKARRKAIDLLYEGDIRKISPASLLLERGTGELSESAYVSVLIHGVLGHQSRIDELLIAYAQGWDLDRIPALDRNILRLALFEMLWGGVDDAIAISQAVELTSELGGEKSSTFINGVLGRISAIKSALPLD